MPRTIPRSVLYVAIATFVDAEKNLDKPFIVSTKETIPSDNSSFLIEDYVATSRPPALQTTRHLPRHTISTCREMAPAWHSLSKTGAQSLCSPSFLGHRFRTSRASSPTRFLSWRSQKLLIWV